VGEPLAGGEIAKGDDIQRDLTFCAMKCGAGPALRIPRVLHSENTLHCLWVVGLNEIRDGFTVRNVDLQRERAGALSPRDVTLGRFSGLVFSATRTIEIERGRDLRRKYAVILGNLRNTKDRFCPGYKENPPTIQMLAQAAGIPHVSGIELVGDWDIRPANVGEMRAALGDFGLECVSIIPDLFGNKVFSKGSFSSANAGVRQRALHQTRLMCDAAMELSCPLINLWPGQDGYDYLLSADYESERAWLCESVAELAGLYPNLRFALEYKPKEPRTHSYLARMADTLLLAQETGAANVGVTIDTGHAFVGGEVVGESIVLAKRAGERLFHMHFNDNHVTTDDDMIVGSVHTVTYLETLYWLARCSYDGWLSMDQYPYREDATQAIGESILWLEAFGAILDVHRDEIDGLVRQQDAIATSRFLRSVLLSPEGRVETVETKVPSGSFGES